MKIETVVKSLQQVGMDEAQSRQVVNAMEDVAEFKISPVVAQIQQISVELQAEIKAVASDMQAGIHRESVTQIRWVVGAVLAAGGLVFAILKFLH